MHRLVSVNRETDKQISKDAYEAFHDEKEHK